MTTSSTPVDGAADALQVLRNRAFDEIAIGDSASLERAFSPQTSTCSRCNRAMWIRNLRCPQPSRDTTEAICANVLISAVLGTRLPGPGTQYVSQNLRLLGAVRPGDRLTVQMQVSSKDTATHHVTLDCTCTSQEGVAVFQGQVEVVAPTERIERTRTALPEIHPDAQGRTGLQHLLAHVAHLQPIRVAVAHPVRCPQPVRCARSTPRGVDRAGAGRATGAAGSSRHRGRAGSGRRRHCGRTPQPRRCAASRRLGSRMVKSKP